MRGGRSVIWFVWPLALSSWFGACKPKTVTEKAVDKVEDIGHEMDQGMKHAEKRVKEAVK